jgi:hypothetical protein
VTGELNRLLICGTGEKPSRAVAVLGDSLGVTPEILRVPNLTHLYQINQDDRESHNVPAVASVLPLLIGVSDSDVPDMLAEVRRAPDLPWATRMIQLVWPVAAAMLILCISYGLVSSQRRLRAGAVDDRAEIQTQIDATNVKFAELSRSRELLGYLKQLERQTLEPDWDLMLGRITQCLPNSSRLNEYRVEPDGHIQLDGAVLDESIVYELVNSLRELPGVTQAALKGTTPEDSIHGTRFVIRLMTSRLPVETASGVRDE